MITPARSDNQRRDALALANRVRTARREAKSDVREGRVSAAVIVRDPGPLVEGMKLEDLLLAIPRVGAWKARGIMGRAGCAPAKTIGGLTDRQRWAVCEELDALGCERAR